LLMGRLGSFPGEGETGDVGTRGHRRGRGTLDRADMVPTAFIKGEVLGSPSGAVVSTSRPAGKPPFLSGFDELGRGDSPLTERGLSLTIPLYTILE